MSLTTLNCGCVIDSEYGDCTCCGCPARDRAADGTCPKHEGLTLDDFVGHYGQNPRRGVITEHLDAARFAGLKVHTMASGRMYVTGPKGGASVPVVCSELIHIDTEDGRQVGRCGIPVVGDQGACAGHAAERDAYLASSEMERMEWERQNDRI